MVTFGKFSKIFLFYHIKEDAESLANGSKTTVMGPIFGHYDRFGTFSKSASS